MMWTKPLVIFLATFWRAQSFFTFCCHWYHVVCSNGVTRVTESVTRLELTRVTICSDSLRKDLVMTRVDS